VLITERGTEGRDKTSRYDLLAVACGALLVVAAALEGRSLTDAGVNIDLGFPPLLADWLPHVGPGTPLAIAVAGIVVTLGPGWAERLSWRPLLGAAFAGSILWTFSLALIDGWQRGVTGRLTSSDEYLHDVPSVTDVARMLRVFSDHILTKAVDPAQSWFWTTHVGAHPPGAFLIFVVLDRIGLGGGAPASLFVILVGSSACVAVAVALRALGGEKLARAALPFGVLVPAAIWVGVSADGMFAAVLAWSVALLAVATSGTGARAAWSALLAGVLYGVSIYLSYGMALGALLPLAVLLLTRCWRRVPYLVVGTLLVVAAFTAAGFWWFSGYADLRIIYRASIAVSRPYSYFVWADFAAAIFPAGPAIVAGVRRCAALAAGPGRVPAVLALSAAALLAMLLADLSGMSKAEVERIWLPFVMWLVPLAALLPYRRRWLVAQAVFALAVNHLLLTVW
jgi:hypothetical protein